MKKTLRVLITVSVAAGLAGCAATSPMTTGRRSRTPTGSYYEVKRGDTLWKISKLHDVDVKKIVKANRLPDATKINVGQKLFIPSGEVVSDYSRSHEKISSSATFSWPVAGKVISYFGSKKGLVKNKGIDIEAREGSNVVAANSGVASFIDENMKGLGKTIIIDHRNGFSTVYAHNSEILVRVGQSVKRNQVIAKVGKTGRAAKPYLHFQIRKGHQPQNPFYYLP
jgi:murein DD-endopeptidase MepM/ murein hydrolase activator NlpD